MRFSRRSRQQRHRPHKPHRPRPARPAGCNPLRCPGATPRPVPAARGRVSGPAAPRPRGPRRVAPLQLGVCQSANGYDSEGCRGEGVKSGCDCNERAELDGGGSVYSGKPTQSLRPPIQAAPSTGHTLKSATMTRQCKPGPRCLVAARCGATDAPPKVTPSSRRVDLICDTNRRLHAQPHDPGSIGRRW